MVNTELNLSSLWERRASFPTEINDLQAKRKRRRRKMRDYFPLYPAEKMYLKSVPGFLWIDSRSERRAVAADFGLFFFHRRIYERGKWEREDREKTLIRAGENKPTS